MKVHQGSSDPGPVVSAEGRPTTPGRRDILLVEDDALISLSYKATLEKQGYRVRAAKNAEMAIALLRKNPESINLVLMDIDLGLGIDGAEAAKRMLEIRDLPIIFLSAHTESEIIAKTGDLGSYGYVDKNSGISVLDVSIRMAFKLFEARRALTRRVSELACLYEVARVLDAANRVSGNALREVAEILPRFWQRPDSACARITVDGVSTRSEGFIDSPWKLATTISVGGHPLGSLEICYRESADSLESELFSDEERIILELIARHIGDFLERRKNLVLLEESERRFRLITETLTDFVYLTRFDAKGGTETEFGIGCLGVTGYTAEEFAAVPDLWLLLIETEDRKRLVEARARIGAGLATMPFEHRIRHKNGSIRRVLETMVAIHDSSGDLRGYDGIILDISKRESEGKPAAADHEHHATTRQDGARIPIPIDRSH